MLVASGHESLSGWCSNRATKDGRLYSIGWLVRDSAGCELFEHKLLSSKTVAEMCGTDIRTVTRQAEMWRDSEGAEGLPGFKIGDKIWRFRREDVIAYLETARSNHNCS